MGRERGRARRVRSLQGFTARPGDRLRGRVRHTNDRAAFVSVGGGVIGRARTDDMPAGVWPWDYSKDEPVEVMVLAVDMEYGRLRLAMVDDGRGNRWER